MTVIKSISGIRGTIGGKPGMNLTPPDLVAFVSGFARRVRETSPAGIKPAVVIGHDARLSGEMVASVVEGTLLGCGIDVIDLGLASTPTVEMAVTSKGAQGGIVLTASHNPGQWNALKLLNARGEFLNAAEAQKVLAYTENGDFEYAGTEELGRILERTNFDREHIDAVLALDLVDAEAVRRAGLKIVVDAVNSVGGIVIPELLRRMGVEVVELNCTPNGRFAHNPEPLPEHLTELSARVVSESADLGIAVDPDVDRLALICEDGSMFGEEYTLVAVADHILAHRPGPTVSNLSSSRALCDVSKKYGCPRYATAVGEVNVVGRMKEVGAMIGGEGNGGVIYPALHYGRDALAGTALFLTMLALKGMTSSALLATYPAYYMAKKRIELTPEIDTEAVLATLKARYSGEQITDIDGVKIDFPDSWVHLRRSNTEPIIRIYTEARNKNEAEDLGEKFIAELREMVKNAN